MNISDRQRKIIELLNKSSESLSSESLSKELDVSSKTIKKDIKEIKSLFGEEAIKAKPGVGYILNSTLINLEELEYKNEDFEILRILMNQDAIDLYDLADKIYISEATLLRRVASMNQLLQKEFDFLRIERQNNLLSINGEENKRKIFNFFLNKELDSHTLDLSKYNDYFKKCDLSQLTQTIFSFHQTIGLELNDFSTVSFILHMAVLIERANQKQFFSHYETIKLDDKSYELANRLIAVLRKEMNVEIPDKETYYIAKLYSTKIVDFHTNPTEITELVEQIIASVDRNYFITFRENQEFKNYLMLHLVSLHARAVENKFLPNPLTEELKIKYPFIYTVTVYATSIIQEEWQLGIPDSEIGYIALHFLSAYKSMPINDSKKVALVSSFGKGNMLLIEQQLNMISSYSFEIVKHLSVFDKTSIPNDVDLVLSTVEIKQQIEPCIYYFDQMLTETDLVKIEDILSNQTSSSIFDKYFHEELFFSQCEFSNKEEVITFLCEKLEDKNFCHSDYLSKVLEREMLSSTSYGNYYAIPHSIKREAKENAVAICSLKNSMNWGEHKVKIVFLLSLKPERDLSFEVLFEELFHLLETKETVNKLASQRKYEDFIVSCNEIINKQA